jgi:hypothetical protein
MRRVVSVVGACAWLGACAGGAVIYNTDIESGYSLSEVAYGAVDGVMPVVVNGDVFAMPHQAFAEAVAAAMPTGIGVAVRFVALPPGAPRPRYYAVWNFGAAVNRTRGSVCSIGEDNPLPAGPPVALGGPIATYVGFCRMGSQLSSTIGTTDGAKSVDDPAFQGLILHTTFEVFPPFNPMLPIALR